MALEQPVWMQNGSYSARQDRHILDLLFGEGVVDPDSGNLEVTERGAGANNSVDVAAGTCIIDGDDQANQGAYLCRNTSTFNVTLSAAPGSNKRHDLIVAQVNDPDAGGSAGDDWELTVVEGSVAASPSDPATPDTAIVLARVLRTAGDSSVVDSMITDLRPTSTTNTFNTQSSLVRYADTTARDAVTPGEGDIAWIDDINEFQAYDGSAWQTAYPAPAVDVQTFTASGTWTKPTGAQAVTVIAWGAGGGGGAGGSHYGGGGGGARVMQTFPASLAASSESVTVAATTAAGNTGGNSSFGTLVTAFGGGPGSGGQGGGGGGQLTVGTAGVSGGAGGAPYQTITSELDQEAGGGGGQTTGSTPAGASWLGGGGGGLVGTASASYAGGTSGFGGGGGGAGAPTGGAYGGGAGGNVGNVYGTGGGGTAGAAAASGHGGAGTAGTGLRGGTGGGGGGTDGTTGGNGGAGGARGGGGGGGAYGGTTNGAGGTGGRGEVIVITYL